MIKTTIRLNADTLVTVQQMAEEQGRKQSELIRDALRIFLLAGRRPKARSRQTFEPHGS